MTVTDTDTDTVADTDIFQLSNYHYHYQLFFLSYLKNTLFYNAMLLFFSDVPGMGLGDQQGKCG